MKQICTKLAIVCSLFSATAFSQNVAQNFESQAEINSLASSCWTFNNFGFTSTSVISGSGSTVSTLGSNSELITPELQIPPSLTVSFSYNTIATATGSKTLKVLLVINGVETLLESINLNGGSASGNFSATYTSANTPGNNINGNRKVIFRTSDNVSVVIDDLSINAPYTYPGGCATAQSPLPVKFSGFSAKKMSNAVALTWTVGTEDNVAGYEVQKSTNGNSFIKIGFVPASGLTSYSYADNKPTETAYYRIKSIDNDTKYAYSIVLNFKGLVSDVVMKAFPMPVQSQLTVQHSTVTESGRIEILSADGRMIKSLALANGTQQTTIDLSQAKAGVYVVRLLNNSSSESLKIVKQ